MLCLWIFRRPCFNTQPPEGGWRRLLLDTVCAEVSTHSRPKAAAVPNASLAVPNTVSTHSRPKAAGLLANRPPRTKPVSTHSRPKAAVKPFSTVSLSNVFQHTAARRRLETAKRRLDSKKQFQHTAARRRLNGLAFFTASQPSFNTQPPEGGCV